jgi:WD40 repeat protein
VSDVFISYSRLDKDFVGNLRESFVHREQDVWIDWEDIPPSQSWWDEIKKGIARANNVVVVLSPNSMASPICHMEIEYARLLKKRIIPVLHISYERQHAISAIETRLAIKEDVTTRYIWESRSAEKLYDANESELKHINFFFFGAELDFKKRFEELFVVIRSDYDHKEEHTALQLRADEWNKRARDASFLLLDTEQKQAEEWLATSRAKEPPPTELQEAYIEASAKRTRQLKNIRRASIIGSGLAIVATLFAIGASFIGVQVIENANSQLRTSEERQAISDAQIKSANLQLTEVAVQVELPFEALRLAGDTQYILGDPQRSRRTVETAALLALRSLKLFPSVQAYRSLYATMPLLHSNALLLGHTAQLIGAKVLADGRILSWSQDGTLRLWDSTGNPLSVLQGHTGAVLGAEVLSDGRILSWSDDETLRLWDSMGQFLSVLEESPVLEARVLSDGRILSLSWDGTLRLWDSMAQPLTALEGYMNEIYGAEVLADGRILAWSWDGTLRLGDSTGQAPIMLEGHTGTVLGAEVLADGRILSWGDDGTVRFWDSMGNPLRVLEGHTATVNGAKLLADGRILSWSDDTTLRLWDSVGNPLNVLRGHNWHVVGAEVLADGRILSWGNEGTLRLWDSMGNPLRVLEGHIHWFNGTESLDNGHILSWNKDGTLRLWDSMGNPLSVLEGHIGPVLGAEVLADGRILSWGEDGTLRLWDGEQALGIFNREEVLTDGRILSWTEDGRLNLLDTEHHPSHISTNYVDGEETLANGRTLSWGEGYTLQLWDRETKSLKILEGHRENINGVAFLTDNRILSWSGDHTLRIWDSEGQTLSVLEGHTSAVFGVEVLDDGRILSLDESGTLRLWEDYGYPTLLESACSRLVRDFLPEERSRYGILDNEPTCPKFATGN